MASPSASSPQHGFASPSAVGIQAETPGSAACAAFEAVATALERDLEDEKRERREQVGFLNKSYSQEKDLLVQRTEALERQLVEARSLWSDERTLLIDRLQKAEAYSGAGDRALRKSEDAAAAALQSAREEAAKCAAELEKSALTSESRLEAECSQIEARSARWSGSYEAILSKNATLEVELDAERRSGKVGIEAAERSAAAHLRDHESSMAAQAERLEEETRAFRRAQDEAARQSRISEEEVRTLRLEVQNCETEHVRLECESAIRLQKATSDTEADARSAAEHAISRVRQECEEGGKEAMLRAIWQLQSADDCIQTMRRQQSQEASACTAECRRAEEMERRAKEEGSLNQQLVARLSKAHEEQLELQRCVRLVEQELAVERAEHAASREAQQKALVNAAHERMDTLRLVDQLRVHGHPLGTHPQRQDTQPGAWAGRSLDVSAPALSHDGIGLPPRAFENSCQIPVAVTPGLPSSSVEPSIERRLPAYRSLEELDATIAAAELERRLWDRIESPPQWRPLTHALPGTLSGEAPSVKNTAARFAVDLPEAGLGDAWWRRQHVSVLK
jgi:hypothetical protein